MLAKRSLIGTALSVALAGVLAGPTGVAGAAGPVAFRHEHEFGTYQQENLVSDQPGVAAITDPNLVNAWGMSHGANTPVWVSDNGADVATLYRGDVMGAPVSAVPLVVSIPGGAPTGQAFNSTPDFTVPGTGAPALFIFAGEDGNLSAWNQAAGTSAVPVGSSAGAVYKGLALVNSAEGPRLLVANFHDNRIDVFDSQFNPVPSTGMFQDPSLPAGYAPFNVAEINGQVFVTYALQDAQRHDDVAGPGHGFVDVYTTEGGFVRRFATRGVLNSPWGMTVAPPTFGRFAGDLLIGNFGDGHIHAFDPRSGELRGVVRGTSGRPLVIDGLWGLIVGDAVAGGPDAVWFSAGPDNESHGLLGILRPAPHRHDRR